MTGVGSSGTGVGRIVVVALLSDKSQGCRVLASCVPLIGVASVWYVLGLCMLFFFYFGFL